MQLNDLGKHNVNINWDTIQSIDLHCNINNKHGKQNFGIALQPMMGFSYNNFGAALADYTVLLNNQIAFKKETKND